MIQNVGGADAELRTLQVSVADGTPTLDAAEDLQLTQEFYRTRTATTSNPVIQASYTDKPPSKVVRHDIYVDSQEKGPDHYCRHGRIFAISSNSPHIQWADLNHAKQTFETKSVLQPQQCVEHEFVFVLTEYPNQHNRQWLRFNVSAISMDEGDAEVSRTKSAGETLLQQDYEIIVPGLPMTSSSIAGEVRPTSFKPTDESSVKSQVWKMDAPLMSPRRRLNQVMSEK
jgi:hypothetical protein